MKPDVVTYELPNTYLRQFFRFLGGNPALLQGTSESPQSLAQLDGRNSFQDYCRFFSNAMEQHDEPAIGLVLGQVNQLANMHGALSVTVLQSWDIRDCLELLLRFIPLRNPAFKTLWVEQEQDIGLEFVFRQSAGAAHIPVAEALLLSLHSIIVAVSQRRIQPSRMELDYPRPVYADRYREIFDTASIRFSSRRLRLMVTRQDAALRTTTDTDPNLRAAAIKRCEELLQGVLGELTTTDRVTQIFADNPGQLWTLRDIARHLNTSERTLQRRLAVEHTSYQKQHDQWLQREAQKLLAEKTLSIESIAMLLGYSDVSNLRHASRRWFGKSPQAYREQLLAGRKT